MLKCNMELRKVGKEERKGGGKREETRKEGMKVKEEGRKEGEEVSIHGRGNQVSGKHGS
jgi:hypothetical protein